MITLRTLVAAGYAGCLALCAAAFGAVLWSNGLKAENAVLRASRPRTYVLNGFVYKPESLVETVGTCGHVPASVRSTLLVVLDDSCGASERLLPKIAKLFDAIPARDDVLVRLTTLNGTDLVSRVAADLSRRGLHYTIEQTPHRRAYRGVTGVWGTPRVYLLDREFTVRLATVTLEDAESAALAAGIGRMVVRTENAAVHPKGR